MANEEIGYRLDVDTGDSAAALAAVRRELTGSGKDAAQAAPKIELFEAAIDEAGDAAKRTAAYAALAEKRIKALGNEGLKTAAKLSVLARVQNRLARLTRGNVMGGKGGGAKGKAGKGFAGGVFKGAAFAMIARFATMAYFISALIPSLVTGIVSLGAAVLGLAGSLAPLAGLLVAYPGYLAAVGQGFIAVKLALKGASDAMKVWSDSSKTEQERNQGLAMFTGGGINKDVAKPFLRQMSMITTEFTYMGYAVQRTLLPAFTGFIKMGRSQLPMIQHYLSATGAAISEVVKNVGGYLGSGRGRDLISTIFGNNVTILSSFGSAARGALSIVLELVTAAGPMLKQMASDLSSFVNRLSGSVEAAGRSGGLVKFFQLTYDTLQKVKGILFPLGQALLNVMKIGSPMGYAMLDVWRGMAENALKFTQSAGGMQKIADWFAYMTPIVWELGYLVRDLVKGLAAMSMNDGFMQIAVTVRTQLLPVVLSFINSTSDQLLPALLKAVQAALELVTAWQGATATSVVFGVIANVLTGIAAITKLWGGALKQVVGVVFLLWAAFKIGRLVPMMLTAVSRGLYAMIPAAQGAAVSMRGLSLAIKSAWASTGIGLIIVGISLVVDALMGMNQEVEEQVNLNKAWADSLFDVNGALDANARATTAKKLADEGVLDGLKRYGIDGQDAVDAILGNNEALDEMVAKLKAVAEADKVTYMTKGGAVIKYGEEGRAALDLIDKLTGMSSAYGVAGKNAKDAAIAAGTWTTEADAAAQATERLNTALQILNGLLDQRAKKRDYEAAVDSLRKQVKKNAKYGFSAETQKGRENQAALDAVVNNATQRADAFLKAGNKPAALRVLEEANKDLTKIAKGIPPEKRGAMVASFAPLQTKLDEIKASLVDITQQEWMIKLGTYGSGYIPPSSPGQTGPKVPKGAVNPEDLRFAGGNVMGGRKYMVGELGPEAFIGKNGGMSIIGKNGPEVKRFSSSGYVVPNHALAEAQQAANKAELARALASATKVSAGSLSGNAGGQPVEAHVHIGTINAQSEFDVIAAVKRGLREADRDARERG